MTGLRRPQLRNAELVQSATEMDSEFTPPVGIIRHMSPESRRRSKLQRNLATSGCSVVRMPPIVVVNSVTKVFCRGGGLLRRRTAERALDALSLQAKPGSILVLLGRNGSGKTTLLKLISAMLLPDSGSVQVGGWDTRRHGSEARRQVGFAITSERSFFARLTARENLEFFAALEGMPRGEARPRVTELLRQVGLENGDGKLVREFSAGMYQRLAIARALLKRPSVLLLDEPSRSLDPTAALAFQHLVRKEAADGTAVILASHSFEEAAGLGDELVLLNDGAVVDRRCMRRDSIVEPVRAFYFARVAGERAAEWAMEGWL